MDMKIVKLIGFDDVRMFVAFSIAAAQTKNLIGVGRAIRKNDREIEGIKIALS
jgi:hypothetical protein